MALTPTGLEIKRFEDILAQIKEDILAELGEGVDLSEKTAVGILTQIFARSQADVWEAMQNVYDGQRVSKAEGINLDDIVVLNDLYRLDAAPSFGNVEFTGRTGTRITPSLRLRSTADNIFSPVSEFLITANRCVDAWVTVKVLQDNTNYSIFIDGTEYSHLTGVGESALDILNGLAGEINGGTLAKASVDTNTEELLVYRDTTDREKRESSMVVTATSFLDISKVTTIGIVQAQEFGDIPVNSGTLIIIDTPIQGLTKVTNRYDLTAGRDQETDAELRSRFYNSFSRTGSGTLDTILTNVRRVSGVTTATISENDGDTTNGDGLPPKSFRVIAAGGDPDAIAQAIWNTKPAGILSFGTSSGTAVDVDGFDHIVQFQRPTPLYGYTRVTYSLFDEETAPLDILGGIQDAVLEYGATLGAGDDIIPNRIIGLIYQKVEGIIIESVECAAKGTQTVPLEGEWTTDRIAIAGDEYTVWDSSQVITVNNTP